MKTFQRKTRNKENSTPASIAASSVPALTMEDNRIESAVQRRMITGINDSQVLQRHAFWTVDAQNVVANPDPVAQQPNYPFIKRVGGNQNHELHNGISKARGAARAQAKIKVSKSSVRNDTSNAQAQGSYMYGVEEGDLVQVNQEYRLPNDTNCVINHTHDDQAELELHTNANNQQDEDTVNHFHAYKYNAGVNIRSQYSNAAQPVGNQRLGAEHYLVNPFV